MLELRVIKIVQIPYIRTRCSEKSILTREIIVSNEEKLFKLFNLRGTLK